MVGLQAIVDYRYLVRPRCIHSRRRSPRHRGGLRPPGVRGLPRVQQVPLMVDIGSFGNHVQFWTPLGNHSSRPR